VARRTPCGKESRKRKEWYDAGRSTRKKRPARKKGGSAEKRFGREKQSIFGRGKKTVPVTPEVPWREARSEETQPPPTDSLGVGCRGRKIECRDEGSGVEASCIEKGGTRRHRFGIRGRENPSRTRCSRNTGERGEDAVARTKKMYLEGMFRKNLNGKTSSEEKSGVAPGQREIEKMFHQATGKTRSAGGRKK